MTEPRPRGPIRRQPMTKTPIAPSRSSRCSRWRPGCLLAPTPVHAQNTHVSPVPKEPCCMNNFRYSGTCEVTPRQGQYCENILSYLNNIDSSGETYCSSTYIRGGWSLIDCSSGTPSGQIGYMTPQTIETEDPSTMQRRRRRQPTTGLPREHVGLSLAAGRTQGLRGQRHPGSARATPRRRQSGRRPGIQRSPRSRCLRP